MKKLFKIEGIYYDGRVWYAVYQKRFLWGWKYLGRYIYEPEARTVAEKLSNPPTYIETKK